MTYPDVYPPCMFTLLKQVHIRFSVMLPQVDKSALTGESDLIALTLACTDRNHHETKNLAHFGTLLTEGEVRTHTRGDRLSHPGALSQGQLSPYRRPPVYELKSECPCVVGLGGGCGDGHGLAHDHGGAVAAAGQE
jgi:hypothetical protein